MTRRLTDQEFEQEPHIDDCGCLFGEPDELCVEYRKQLREQH